MGPAGELTAEGIDSCSAFTNSQMSTLYSNPNWFWFGAYLGGLTATSVGCAVPDASFYSSNSVWGYSLIYDGVQDPCSSNTYLFPLNDNAGDYNDGLNAGANAVAAAYNDGFDSSPVYIWYDLEGYDTGNPACVTAAQQFMEGYTAEVEASGNTAGVYGGAGCSSGESDLPALLQVSPHPSYYWLANYDGNPNVYVQPSCIPATYWTNHQRLKQYSGSPPEIPFDGTYWNLDQDCSLSWIENSSSYAPASCG